MRRNRICHNVQHQNHPSRNSHSNFPSELSNKELREAYERRSYRILPSAYSSWIPKYINDGFKPYLFTFMFDQIAGGDPSIIGTMMADITRFYSRIVTRLVRKPNSPKALGRLPVLIGVADRPVLKSEKSDSDLDRPNSGLHFHGCFLRPRKSRLHGRLDDHVDENLVNYTRETRIRCIDVERIRDSVDYVVGYTFKSFARGLVGNDVLVLPRALAELPSKKRR